MGLDRLPHRAGGVGELGGALKVVGRQQEATFSDSSVTAEVGIGLNESGFALEVTLRVELGGIDQATAEQLVEAAHQVCPYSNATRGNVPVTLETVTA